MQPHRPPDKEKLERGSSLPPLNGLKMCTDYPLKCVFLDLEFTDSNKNNNNKTLLIRRRYNTARSYQD